MKINAEATGIVLKSSYNNEHYFLTYGNILRICRSQFAPIFLNEARTIVYKWSRRFRSYDAVNEHTEYFLDRKLKWKYSYQLPRVLNIQEAEWTAIVNISGILIPNSCDPLKRRAQIFLHHTQLGLNIFDNLIDEALANLDEIDMANTDIIIKTIGKTELRNDILKDVSLKSFKSVFLNEIVAGIKSEIESRNMVFSPAQEPDALSDMYQTGSFVLSDEE